MFTIERRVAWLFRAALKRCFDSPAQRADQTLVHIRISEDGLMMHASAPEIAVIYGQSFQTSQAIYTFPISHFAEFEGKTPDPVEFSTIRPGLIAARWVHRGANREIQIPQVEPESTDKIPEMPKRFMPMPPHIVQALHDASRSTGQLATKFVINRVQLKGMNGTIIGTDTRQLFMSSGYAFPFKEDLLIPRSGIFGLQPLQLSDNVGIGRTDTRLAVRIGPWTFSFVLDKQGRYPDASLIIPKTSSADTRFHLDPLDAERFLNSLTRKIRNSNDDLAVTLDLTEQPCFRYAIEDRVVEVPLAKSTVIGKPIRCCVYLQSLLQTLEFRFADFEIRDPSKPIVARDRERLYMVMPLSESAAVLPRPDAVRAPAVEAPTRSMVPVKRSAAKTPIILPATDTAIADTRGFDLIGEAEGLRQGLFKVADHAGRILGFLREVCTQQKLFDVARSSLLALGSQSTSGGKP